MAVEIRQATLEDRVEIGSFFEESSYKYRYPERWEWLNLHNPFVPNDFGLPSWIAILNGRIVGHQGAMLVPMKIGDNTVCAGWGVDTFVSSKARGLGVAKSLSFANQSSHPVFAALEMTDVLRAIRKKLGCQEGPAVSLLYRVERSFQSPLSEEIHRYLVKRFGSRSKYVINAAWRLKLLGLVSWGFISWIRRRGFQNEFTGELPNTKLVRIERFDSQADALWEAVRTQYILAVERTSKYLNWKYVEQPHMRHQCYYVLKDGTVQGIVVFRRGEPPEPPIGVICELYLRKGSPKDYYSLVQKAAAELGSEGVWGIWIATADPELEGVLHKQGFLRLRQQRIVLHISDKCYHDETAYLPALFGKGDHDWDQFPNLRYPSIRELRSLGT
jgi:hypothetical protein